MSKNEYSKKMLFNYKMHANSKQMSVSDPRKASIVALRLPISLKIMHFVTLRDILHK